MKGLLLKDWYVIKRLFKLYLVLGLVFIVVSCLGEGNIFFAAFTCIFCGSMPVSLLSLDEQSRWSQYSAALPCSRALLVSEKYVIGLIFQAVAVVATGVAHGVRMGVTGALSLGQLASILLLIPAIASVNTSFCLPLVYKFGMERGRMGYFVTMGIACGEAVAVVNILQGSFGAGPSLALIMAVIVAVCAALYVLSWLLSIAIYKKQEI